MIFFLNSSRSANERVSVITTFYLDIFRLFLSDTFKCYANNGNLLDLRDDEKMQVDLQKDVRVILRSLAPFDA